jgi:serine/threonine protein kinase
MLANPPTYTKGKLDQSSVEIKVVDFGIFGSIAGIKRESVNFGSLKYMSPELIKGNYGSSPKIDIWCLGLMLHGLIFGFLPFNKGTTTALQNQILTEELDYKTLKRVKTQSIKDDVRRDLNTTLRKTSDNLIDLLERMLCKDPMERIDMLQIFDHPWITKYSRKYEESSDEEKRSSTTSEVSAEIEDSVL